MKHIALLAGGLSSERTISFESAKCIKQALLALGHKVTEIDPNENLAHELNVVKPDIVYNALHGGHGEDGSIAGLLEVLKIPYTLSGVLASSIGMNKYLTRQILENLGIRFPHGLRIKVDALMELANDNKHPIPKPYVIKPVNQGSTLGVYIVKKKGQNFKTMQQELSWNFGEYALVEEYIPGQEISTAVISDVVLGSLELKPKTGFYDYASKYTDGLTEHIYPANLPNEIYEESLKFAQIAHDTLGCRTISRSDMRYNPQNNKLYFLEINTHPGFTNLSIVPDVAANNGIDFMQLVDIIVKGAKLDI